jgi:hypothetical protein
MQPVLRSKNPNAAVGALNFAMKAIGSGVRGVDFPT